MNLKTAQKFIKISNDFKTIGGYCVEYSPETTLYYSHKIRSIIFKSYSGKNEYCILTKDLKNTLTIITNSHFVQRWEERIGNLKKTTIKNIMSAVYFSYVGDVIKEKNNSFKIIYPCKYYDICIVGIESERNCLTLKTCYLRDKKIL